MKLRAKKNFLTTCRTEKLTPKFIEDQSTTFNILYQNCHAPQRIANFIDDTKKRHLNLCIRNVFTSLRMASKKLYESRRELYQVSEPNIVRNFIENQKTTAALFLESETNRLELKLNRLREKSNMTYNDDWFINLTNHNIPNNVKHILSFGPKFQRSL